MFGDPGDDDVDIWKLVAFTRHLPQLSPPEEVEMRHLNPKSPDEIQEDNSITVTTTDGTTPTVTTTADTKYNKMDTVVSLKDIKVGDHVVIHAAKKDNKPVAATVKMGMGNMSDMKMDGKSSSPSPQPR